MRVLLVVYGYGQVISWRPCVVTSICSNYPASISQGFSELFRVVLGFFSTSKHIDHYDSRSPKLGKFRHQYQTLRFA